MKTVKNITISILLAIVILAIIVGFVIFIYWLAYHHTIIFILAIAMALLVLIASSIYRDIKY